MNGLSSVVGQKGEEENLVGLTVTEGSGLLNMGDVSFVDVVMMVSGGWSHLSLYFFLHSGLSLFLFCFLFLRLCLLYFAKRGIYATI